MLDSVALSDRLRDIPAAHHVTTILAIPRQFDRVGKLHSSQLLNEYPARSAREKIKGTHTFFIYHRVIRASLTFLWCMRCGEYETHEKFESPCHEETR